MARTQTSTRQTAVKPMNPRQPDQKYMGDEPVWTLQPSEENRQLEMIYAFRWYSYYYDRKEAREFVADWLDRDGRSAEAKRYRSAPESVMDNLSVGWVARMATVGLVLQERELETLNNHVVSALTKRTTETVEAAPTGPTRPTIQDRLRERAAECAGEIEGLFDEFMTRDYRLTADYKPGVIIRSMNIQPQQISLISEPWKKRLSELTEAADGRDEQLTEAYGHMSRAALKTAIKFCEMVIHDCETHIQHKKMERKPRARRAVSPEKLTEKFKYQAAAQDLSLKSEPVTRLVGGSEAYLYNTATRKLTHVVADSHLGTFSVKGSSVVGIDPSQTVSKTLRKPAEQLRELMAAGKPATRKIFRDIKTTETRWNCRGNENLVILRVW